MCGRFTLRTPSKAVAELFDLSAEDVERAAREPARYNIAPSQTIAVVRHGEGAGHQQLAFMRWGLVPRWADDASVGNRMINARSETASTRPAFREAFRRRRCLVPADGFFEWRRQDRPSQPFYIHLAGQRPFAMAGLWERWEGRGEVLESCTILTTDANELVRPLHDRMPVILPPEAFDQWLDPTVQDLGRLTSLLRPLAAERMASYAVSRVVNSPKHDDPQCVAPADTEPRQGLLFE